MYDTNDEMVNYEMLQKIYYSIYGKKYALCLCLEPWSEESRIIMLLLSIILTPTQNLRN